MSLKENLMSDMQDAMRSGDELRKSTLRMARAAVKNAEIARMSELDDAGVQDVLRKEIKQRRESAEEYKRGNRPDLVERELAEVVVLEAYLPQQMAEDEVEREVRAVLAGMDNPGPKDMGKVMPAVMGRLKGRADGRMISQVVSRLLAEGAA
ncbi:MAG TPA: GatB/YqeY domain-containing protein [Chloroflexia bacterium]|nr:GatB/YqeY domain-containing protein [Chloroflexia bacterium]